jgi:hypothetical protein
MSATTRPAGNASLSNGQTDTNRRVGSDHGRRLATETKSSFKTTEFIAYIVVLAGLLIAGAVTSGGTNGAGVQHGDAFSAHQVWLYAAILTVGYMISRGLSKAGSKQPYDEQ